MCEHRFKIECSKNIDWKGFDSPEQQIYDFLRDNGFYSVDIKDIKKKDNNDN